MKYNANIYKQCTNCGKSVNIPNYNKHYHYCLIHKDDVPTGPRNAYTKALAEGKPKPIIKYKRNKHTNETKKKISEARIKYLLKNPSKVPYLLNHSSKESYPEKYFRKLLKKYKINFIQELQIGLYSLDFAIIDKMIDIEIDGEQHFLKESIKRDAKRDRFLRNLGWKIVRIRWSDYQKLSLDQKFDLFEREILQRCVKSI